MKNIIYFFGAGAEAVFSEPLGSVYTKVTVLAKRGSLYEELEKYYKRVGVKKYIKEYLFDAKSKDLFEEYKRTVIRMDAPTSMKPKEEKVFVRHQNTFIDADTQRKRRHTSKLRQCKRDFEKQFDSIVSEDYNPDNVFDKIKEPYRSAVKNFSFFGSIEKDFACIIDPYRMGGKRFWRLINFFWGAFFSILIPLLDNYDGYAKYTAVKNKSKNEKYGFVLNNLEEVLKIIEDIDPDVKTFNCNNKYLNYYSVLKGGFSNPDIVIKAAMTTNYTPFVRRYFEDKAIYLAGELGMFEEIKTMHVGKYDECAGAVFPFMQTQAVVKPIISKYQMEQYSKAVSVLEEKGGEFNYLVVIGFSFCENDSHIMGIVRDSLLDGGITKIVYYKYCEEPGKFNGDEEKQKVLETLRLTDDKKWEDCVVVRLIPPKKEDLYSDVQKTIENT